MEEYNRCPLAEDPFEVAKKEVEPYSEYCRQMVEYTELMKKGVLLTPEQYAEYIFASDMFLKAAEKAWHNFIDTPSIKLNEMDPDCTSPEPVSLHVALAHALKKIDTIIPPENL